MTVWLVRHACAGHKDEWSGTDWSRPLDGAGEAQAKALTGLHAQDRVRALVSSPARRCIDTLQPLSRALDLPVHVREDLGPEGGAAGVTALLEDARHDGSVVCTHGEVLEQVLPALLAGGALFEGHPDRDDLLAKGAAWRLDRDGARWRGSLYSPLPRAACPRHGESEEGLPQGISQAAPALPA